MKKHILSALMVLALPGFSVQPLLGVSKETLQMMQQLDALQQAVQNLQKTVDTQGAVLKTLVEQASDNVNSMKSVVNDLRGTQQQNLATSSARLDSVTTQMQALSESLDEAKARISKLGEQMTQIQNILTTLPAGSNPNPGGPAAGPGGPGSPGSPPVPDADSLYSQGLSYYNGGQWDLSTQSFTDYLKYYKDTDRASNAQFYIGECYYSQGDFKHAVEAYDLCIEKYPTGNKAAAAQLKKGYSLLALQEKTAGIRELRSVIQRFPDAPEAEYARQRLKKLGIAVPPPAPAHHKAS
ncbi:MAG TPA: tetratricopeptide repeat protein [Terriglobia bacterium]|nr:tetratricopeptide repeat protein [Terriglobia bacterium]